MSTRALDSNGDWIFGTGISAYLIGNSEVAQNIKTRLLCFINDCFWDVAAGIDWLNLLGSKNQQLALQLAISAVILNTANVTALSQISLVVSPSRQFTVQYLVQTTYGPVNGSIATPV
jgi:hypothetical protein